VKRKNVRVPDYSCFGVVVGVVGCSCFDVTDGRMSNDSMARSCCFDGWGSRIGWWVVVCCCFCVMVGGGTLLCHSLDLTIEFDSKKDFLNRRVAEYEGLYCTTCFMSFVHGGRQER
jgi:hypothetical protein